MQCCFAMMQWCIIELGPRLSDHEITDDHNTSITLYQRIKKHSSGWLSATEQCCTTVWKYVRKHYLFKNAKFPRTKLEENCEHRGANHVQIKDKFTSIFFRQIEAIGVYYPSNIRKARETELFTNSLWGFHKKKKLWAFNTKQWDHELIRRNRRKLISGNYLLGV